MARHNEGLFGIALGEVRWALSSSLNAPRRCVSCPANGGVTAALANCRGRDAPRGGEARGRVRPPTPTADGRGTSLSFLRFPMNALRSAVLLALLTTGSSAIANDDWFVRVGAHAVDPKSNNALLAGDTLQARIGSDLKPTLAVGRFQS